VPAAASQEQLRRAFGRWGRPRAIRVDNGAPWGSTGELPTELALWLIGLGIAVIWNPPRRPQANGVIERSQGTGKRWAEPARCRDAAELQRRVDQEDHIQRERYPIRSGRSRLATFPGLAHSGRAYRAEDEPSHWELGRVLEHLAGRVVVRRADAAGTISLYNRSRYVSRLVAGREVDVSLDPIEREWVYADRQGQCYRRQAAEELTADRVRRLDVCQHRDRPDKRSRRIAMAGFAAQPPVG
jgi:transposase InsO family protein